jgi:LmbE family N-acetylglucosaminyl deacetylase
MEKLLGKNILFITAHPDDESFLASGTIYRNRASGGRSVIVCATYGEEGKSHVKKAVTAKELRSIRKAELEKVSQFLKVDKLHHLGLPDGKLPEYEKELYEKVMRIIRGSKPELIASFGSDGISGHVDHIAIGRVAKRAARQCKIPFMAFSPTPSFAKQFETAKRRRAHGVYATSIHHAPHTIKIKVDPKIKMKALLFHASQMSDKNPFTHFSKKVIREILNYEYFRM